MFGEKSWNDITNENFAKAGSPIRVAGRGGHIIYNINDEKVKPKPLRVPKVLNARERQILGLSFNEKEYDRLIEQENNVYDE